MPGWLAHRAAHYLLLLAVGCTLTFPNLGQPSLWDDDEGENAEAAREMREAGTWVVPTSNWKLRTAKPVFLYWLQRLSYDAFDVSEWSARFPSAVMSLLTIFLTYELGRRQFGAATGLLGGLILASSIESCKLAHAATPDATLIAFTTLYLFTFWRGQENGGRSWFVPCGIASGLAVLTKGPVGLVLPAAVVGGFLLWHREIYRVWDRRLIAGCVAWTLVAGPWYGVVAAETHGEWIWKFINEENLDRAAAAKENHSGIPVIYYLICLCLFFAPWSSFLVLTIRHAWFAALSPLRNDDSAREEQSQKRATRFLLVWIGVYLLAFSIAATKLPSYIAPLYPALALLTARFLLLWAAGQAQAPRWLLRASIAGVALTGIVVALGLAIAGGLIPLPIPSSKMRIFPGLESWAWIGLVPLTAAVMMAWHWRQDNRHAMLQWLTVASVLFMGLLAAFLPNAFDRFKAPRPLVAESGAYQPRRDIRVGSFLYRRPSLVFYVGRQVELVENLQVAASFLEMPHPSYLFVPEDIWEERVKALVNPRVRYRIAARHYDMTLNRDILVITNDK